VKRSKRRRSDSGGRREKTVRIGHRVYLHPVPSQQEKPAADSSPAACSPVDSVRSIILEYLNLPASDWPSYRSERKEVDDKARAWLTANAGREVRTVASRPPRHCWRLSCGRMHEECEDCALQAVEPPQCEGHQQGPVACERFERLTVERLSDPCPSCGEDGDIHG